MQVWIVCFVVFFAAAELYQWLQGMTLPMPVWVIAGALLAVASNAYLFYKQSQQQIVFQPVQPPAKFDPPVASSPSPEVLPQPQTAAAPPRYYPGVQLPNLTPEAGRSISFSVQKPKSVSEAED